MTAGRRPGRFLLTGSADLLLIRRVSESLAGRASYLTLWPMTRREQKGRGRCGIWDDLLDTRDEGWKDVGLLPIEVKATGSPRLRDAAHLRTFRSEYGRRARAGGRMVDWLTPDVLAVPWWKVLWVEQAGAEHVRGEA